MNSRMDKFYNIMTRTIMFISSYFPLYIMIIILYLSKITKGFLEKNILIRDASNFKFLDYHFVRLAIKDRESNIKVLEALADIMEYRG